MSPSIFDSQAERELYRRLNFKWSRKVDVFAQVSCRSVFKDGKIRTLGLPEKGRQYLCGADLDFVVCQPSTGEPILIIEFDGIGGGYSRDGKYVLMRAVENDPHRKLKLDRKLQAASATGIPMVVLSFEEVQVLTNRKHSHSVLDGVISHFLAAPMVHQYVGQAAASLGPDATDSQLQDAILGAELDAEYTHNPIARNILEMWKGLPISGHGFAFLRDRPGFVGMEHRITGGLKKTGNSAQCKILVKHALYIRDFDAGGLSTLHVLNQLGEYCLLAKAHDEVGTSIDAWVRLADTTPWTEM
jgi:hypothetical protein